MSNSSDICLRLAQHRGTLCHRTQYSRLLSCLSWTGVKNRNWGMMSRPFCKLQYYITCISISRSGWPSAQRVGPEKNLKPNAWDKLGSAHVLSGISSQTKPRTRWDRRCTTPSLPQGQSSDSSAIFFFTAASSTCRTTCSEKPKQKRRV